MGKRTDTSPDIGAIAAGSFTAAGNGTGVVIEGRFNLAIWGTFVGSVRLEKSFDGGATWIPVTALGSPVSFSAPATEAVQEGEINVLYRVACTSWSSGTINWRLSQ